MSGESGSAVTQECARAEQCMQPLVIETLCFSFFPQLFVKYVPKRTTQESIRALFSPYGRVLDIKDHASKPDVRFVVSGSVQLAIAV